MADVATRLRNFLLAQATVAAPTGGRICETHVAQHLPDPYIRFRQTTSENADVLNGSAGDSPLFEAIEIECVAKKEEQTRTLTAAVRTVLHLYRGTFDDTSAKGCFVDTANVDRERLADGSDTGYFIGTLETRIFL